MTKPVDRRWDRHAGVSPVSAMALREPITATFWDQHPRNLTTTLHYVSPVLAIANHHCLSPRHTTPIFKRQTSRACSSHFLASSTTPARTRNRWRRRCVTRETSSLKPQTPCATSPATCDNHCRLSLPLRRLGCDPTSTHAQILHNIYTTSAFHNTPRFEADSARRRAQLRKMATGNNVRAS